MSRCSLLVVDEDEALRALLVDHLGGAGHEVTEARSGAEAEAALRDMKFDAVLLAASLPDANGLELLFRHRSAGGRTPMVVMAGPGNPEAAMRAMRLGATDYLTKPFELFEVDDALVRAVGGGDPSAGPRLGLPTAAPVLVARSAAMARVTGLIQRIAGSDVPVLLVGECGTGKEVVAREIHRLSQRSSHAFAKVSCAALPSELLESELFGHARGAFTGATGEKPGKLEVADRGTVFLDEVTELPVRLQAKLLQALQDEEVFRVGGKRSVRSDMRVVAATQRELESEIEKGSFREDLFYRLNVVTLRLPPLRERREDIVPLAQLFLGRYSERYRRGEEVLPPEVASALETYDWPGNARELENTVRRIVVLGDPFAVLDDLRNRAQPAPVLTLVPPEPGRAPKPQPPPPPVRVREDEVSLKDIGKRAAMLAEREAILAMLQRTAWNKRKAALNLRISYKALLYKIKESGLVDPRVQAEV